MVTYELADTDGLHDIQRDSASVIHLGVQATKADWPAVKASKFEDALSLFAATRLEYVPCVLFASFDHTIGYSPNHWPFATTGVFRPDSYYRGSNAFGRSLCMLCADKFEMRTFATKIDISLVKPINERTLSTSIHREDLAQLIWIDLAHQGIHVEIFYRLSTLIDPYFDSSRGEVIGYKTMQGSSDSESNPPDLVHWLISLEVRSLVTRIQLTRFEHFSSHVGHHTESEHDRTSGRGKANRNAILGSVQEVDSIY